MGIEFSTHQHWPNQRDAAVKALHAAAGHRGVCSLSSAERERASWAIAPASDAAQPRDLGELDLEFGDEEVEPEQRTILVVDDDNGIRDALGDVLDQLGYSVVGARDGVEALELLHGGCEPSVVLLDLGMPAMNGWQFREELRRDRRFVDLPVVVITASPGQVAAELGVAEVLTKPVQLARLIDILDVHAQGHTIT
ncbi:MAG TPA: response regulator [Polyangiaceae bacterium]|nr:response regulator [Polyangiaceae bacterium]